MPLTKDLSKNIIKRSQIRNKDLKNNKKKGNRMPNKETISSLC